MTLVHQFKYEVESAISSLPHDHFAQQLDINGVVIIPNVFSRSQLEEFNRASHDAFEKVKVAVSNSTRKELEYMSAFDRVYRQKKYYYDHDDGSQIIELAQGRYDFSLDRNHGVFSTPEFLSPEPIQSLMKAKLRTQYCNFAGAVPAVPKSEDGPWHRDIYPLFVQTSDSSEVYDDTIEIKVMPPFYYTLLIPLDRMDCENGSTEFVLGSHRKSYSECDSLPHFQAEVEAGSVLLFDGRIFHRGRANQTDCSRMVLYQVYHKSWYNDY